MDKRINYFNESRQWKDPREKERALWSLASGHIMMHPSKRSNNWQSISFFAGKENRGQCEEGWGLCNEPL